ncbi:transcriptional regulator GlxA family with amidase domain [Branchiibius hedensis]|uniref:Transcriptional regulator GlxA family, contains an amidase domain and an AraC-type DNA-binding HTH domain n=2 Tax=Branchiibius hedensis TaxID=672460 RepID=A0A2Y8ZWC3_9MICO|nr:transcriptional regulator GlxA family with amidase domain [Branchiibius hedensis]SSA34569.1 Transcriptional regulator GlxA family, contains an amidase domain and an AraC-type DNA-binding HTH domain [Branchiibius hedensis]
MVRVCKNLAMQPHRVVVLALDGVITMELGFPSRFLGHRSLLPGWPSAPAGSAPYDVRHVTLGDRPVRTSAGFDAAPTHSVDDLRHADTVIVCGFNDNPILTTGELSDELRAALDTVPASARWVSICTGAFVLAAYGLLDGRRATTHWMHAQEFRRFFPQVDLDPEVLFVDHGDVLTSAGNAAGIDVLLHLIRTDIGPQIANQVARGCVVAPMRSGGQAQFIERPVPQRLDGGLAPVRDWATRHLAESITLESAARQAAMSVRTFTRRFREETGQTFGQWLTGARIEAAKELLEGTDLNIESIAGRSGFGTSAAFRAQFRAGTGLAPAAYRATFSRAA